jgi:hypothetical protein
LSNFHSPSWSNLSLQRGGEKERVGAMREKGEESRGILRFFLLVGIFTINSQYKPMVTLPLPGQLSPSVRDTMITITNIFFGKLLVKIVLQKYIML